MLYHGIAVDQHVAKGDDFADIGYSARQVPVAESACATAFVSAA